MFEVHAFSTRDTFHSAYLRIIPQVTIIATINHIEIDIDVTSLDDMYPIHTPPTLIDKNVKHPKVIDKLVIVFHCNLL